MKKVNIVYYSDYNDVDILLVQDNVANNIESIVQIFFNWLQDPQNGEQFAKYTEDGLRYLCINAEEFVWWINTVWCPCDEKAIIVEKHTIYHPEYPTGDF